MVPRGAVAIVLRCAATSRFALVTRSNPPNQNQWSLPGGKIRLGERVLDAAARELEEEVGLGRDVVSFSGQPFTTSDVIVPKGGAEDEYSHHYLISQVWAEAVPPPAAGGAESRRLVPGDDAARAAWVGMGELDAMVERGETTREVADVVRRGVELSQAGLLPVA